MLIDYLRYKPLQTEMNTNENRVRKALANSWIELFEKYAQPGTVIPPGDLLKREFVNIGVDVAISALEIKNPLVYHWTGKKIRQMIEKELTQINFAIYIKKAMEAQKNPEKLEAFKQEILSHLQIKTPVCVR